MPKWKRRGAIPNNRYLAMPSSVQLCAFVSNFPLGTGERKRGENKKLTFFLFAQKKTENSLWRCWLSGLCCGQIISRWRRTTKIASDSAINCIHGQGRRKDTAEKVKMRRANKKERERNHSALMGKRDNNNIPLCSGLFFSPKCRSHMGKRESELQKR